GGAYEHLGVDESLHRTRSVQAIAASRSTQEASDGAAGDDNSPFTRSLLRALEEMPQTLPRDRFFFTTNQLFHALGAYVAAATNVKQTPQCRWLDGVNAGEFSFFPDPDASFDAISDESRRLLLTMVPSTFGNWWPEEMPWFMPGLRLEILENRAESRSTLLEEVDKSKLREAAMLTIQRLRSGPAIDAVRKRRLGHLKILLDAEETAGRRAAYLRVLDDLKEATEAGPVPEAVDVHYLAILQHLVGDHAAAKPSYERALKLYEHESERFVRMKALKALCHSDYGMLLGELNRNDEAFEQFRTARGLFGLGTPPSFRVFCLTKEADSRRARGFTGASDRTMELAIELVRKIDPDEVHPLTAAAHKHYAWAKMQQWEFIDAGGEFKTTLAILDKPSNRERPECQIDQLHAKHGLAMIHRFRGDDRRAIEAYSTLTREIADAIRSLERRTEADLNLAEVRALLYDRLVNSLERQADCYLFGRRPDLEAAAYYYRRGIQLVGQVPENRRAAIECDLLYRQSIALLRQCLDAEDPGARDVGPGHAAAARDFLKEQALKLIARAADLTPATEPLPISTRIDRELAAFLARVASGNRRDDEGRDEPEAALAKLLDDLRGQKQRFDRDELERLMYAHRLLIERQAGRLDRFVRLELAEQLHEYCRSTLRLAEADPGILAYLRPYFDAIFRVKVHYQPSGVGSKELIELVWEATTGELDPPPVANQPVLAMYVLEDRCHLVLDVPHGRSDRFEVDPGELPSLALIMQSIESGRTFPCPDGLRRGLRAIRLADGQNLLVHFRDPVLGLGTSAPGSSNGRDGSALARTSDGSPTIPTYVFPFDLRASMGEASCGIIPIGTRGTIPRKSDLEEKTAGDASKLSSSR
ncbi:MAG: caspase, partial [Isosphaeraceae bacterium]